MTRQVLQPDSAHWPGLGCWRPLAWGHLLQEPAGFCPATTALPSTSPRSPAGVGGRPLLQQSITSCFLPGFFREWLFHKLLPPDGINWFIYSPDGRLEVLCSRSSSRSNTCNEMSASFSSVVRWFGWRHHRPSSFFSLTFELNVSLWTPRVGQFWTVSPVVQTWVRSRLPEDLLLLLWCVTDGCFVHNAPCV